MTLDEYQDLLRRTAEVSRHYVPEENAVLRLTLARKGAWPTLGATGARGPWGTKTMYYTRKQVRNLLARAQKVSASDICDIEGELLR